AVTSGKWQVARTQTMPPAIMSRVTCHVSPFYWLALSFFALGLMSKPMLVTLPFLLLLLDCWPLGRVTSDKWRGTRFRIPVPQLSSLNHLLLEKLPFCVLSAASCVAAVLAQRQAIEPMDVVPSTLRLDNALISYVIYLVQMVWPEKL